MGFPGPPKNLIEFFVHKLYGDRRGGKLSTGEIQREAESLGFPDAIDELFDALPEGEYDEQGLIDALNRQIERTGHLEAVGGWLERREQIPADRELAYQEQYQTRRA